MAELSGGGSEPREIPAGRTARGRVVPPPSKSVTHRYLNLALLAGAPATVRRPLLAEDTLLFLDVLRALGWSVEVSEEAAGLTPPADRPPESAELFCGNAGTLFRFLTATLTTLPGRFRVDGTPRLRERPVGPLVDALEALGAHVRSVESIEGARRGHAPLAVRGPSLGGGRATLDAGESSQYLSALLMACLRARRPTELHVPALTSGPYVELTRRAIRRFTAIDPIQAAGATWRVAPTRVAPPDDLAVEGDWSAACYPAAAAALTGGRVELAGLDPDSAQGDRSFLELLARMGARVERRDDGVAVEGGRLAAVEVDLSGSPDQVPTLAALAPFALGTTRIYNISHLRIKESDRLHAMALGLSRLGVPVEELPDGLVIEGCWADGVPADTAERAAAPVTIDPVGDHRIAMSFALVGLRRPGVRVADPEVVGKSYPRFWEDFESLLG